MSTQAAHPELLQDPFAGWLAVDVGGVVHSLTELAVSPLLLAETVLYAPYYVGDDPDEAIEYIHTEHTVRRSGRVRVATDNTWTLEA